MIRLAVSVVVLLLLTLCRIAYAQDQQLTAMENSDWDGQPVASEPRTELQNFAMWFDQDSDLEFSTPQEGTRIYLAGLATERRAVLKEELKRFVSDNSDTRDDLLLAKWFALGAQAWQRDLDIKIGLRQMLDMM